MGKFLFCFLSFIPSVCLSETVKLEKGRLNSIFLKQAEAGERLAIPPLMLTGDIEVGSLGVIESDIVHDVGTSDYSYAITLLQRIGDQEGLVTPEAVISFNEPSGLSSRRRTITSQGDSFILKGVDLTNVADGSMVDVNGLFVVTSTRSYQSVGGRRTAFVIELCEDVEVPAYPEAIGLEFRNWNDSSGRFSVEAVYLSYEKGIAKLQKKDESIIEVPISRLDRESQAFVRKHIKFAKDYTAKVRKDVR